jgi:uncharacterized damage-inducible protein DinB
MRRHWIWLLATVALSSSPLFAQDQSQPKTVSDSINLVWKQVSADFIALAEAMPEEKWNFKPAQGAFKDVRTFAEQVKHVACGNEAWAKKIGGEAPPERCDLGGPNPAKTKAEILHYLRDSFGMMDKVVAGTTSENLLHQNGGPYWGPNRLSALSAALWHVSDHYGQLVLYLRMNGITPPASK